ncbi:hypothetical protein [Pseudochrobactrum sp. XF203]|uniref:hypothetical protein n=1 Tax=Pseudochrobactrum sp. XF203 TaxID=2879116 RepID=UPI001CE28FF1|nr:hypothetical protein [Pseudochrobactrum sp. XF203]UCA47034.1 hypothetical protein LDL70_07490 [Pseudochrobactrum sp. XF203]
MRSIILTFGILLFSSQTSIAQQHQTEQSLYPPGTISKEEFLLQLAVTVAAHEGCENFKGNYQYYNGYISATGLEPFNEPIFIKLLAESRQEISNNKETACLEIRETDTLTKELNPSLAPLFKSKNN